MDNFLDPTLSAAKNVLFKDNDTINAHRQVNFQREMFDKNVALQKEFAQHGIRWKIEDAARAGIHPVVAMGGQGQSFSPVSVGGVSFGDGDGIGRSLMDMGQNISRSVRATATETQRQELQMNELRLEHMKLQNELLGSRIAAINQQSSQVGPAQPEESTIQPEITYHKTKGGGIAPAPSEAFADRAEDQFIPQLAWAMRNMVLPEAPNRSTPPGTQWFYHPFRAEWKASRKEDNPLWLNIYNWTRETKRGK